MPRASALVSHQMLHSGIDASRAVSGLGRNDCPFEMPAHKEAHALGFERRAQSLNDIVVYLFVGFVLTYRDRIYS